VIVARVFALYRIDDFEVFDADVDIPSI